MRIDVILDPDLSPQEVTELGLLAEKLGLGAASLGDIGLGYLSAYTAGQFISGAIGMATLMPPLISPSS